MALVTVKRVPEGRFAGNKPGSLLQGKASCGQANGFRASSINRDEPHAVRRAAPAAFLASVMVSGLEEINGLVRDTVH
jgi:hypothetical protein